MILGVCEKIGKKFDIEPWIIRIGFLSLFVTCTWTGILFYLFANFLLD